MKKMIVAFMAIALMALVASCNNTKPAEPEQAEQEQMGHVYSSGEYLSWFLQRENSHFYDYNFSWSKDTVFILSESGERVGKCALNEMYGENELFPNSDIWGFGLNNYFITDEECHPFMPYSFSEYDDYEHEDICGDEYEDICGDVDILKRWFIPNFAGSVDTIDCTFGVYERKFFVYNIVKYYSIYREITLTNPDDITLYRASGDATIRLGDNTYEYPFKDQWLAVVKYGPNALDRDAILLAYGIKIGFSLDEITVFEPIPRWIVPLVNTDEIESWEFCQPEYYRPTNFALYEYVEPDHYFVDVINEKVYDLRGNEVDINSIKRKKNI